MRCFYTVPFKPTGLLSNDHPCKPHPEGYCTFKQYDPVAGLAPLVEWPHIYRGLFLAAEGPDFKSDLWRIPVFPLSSPLWSGTFSGKKLSPQNLIETMVPVVENATSSSEGSLEESSCGQNTPNAVTLQVCCQDISSKWTLHLGYLPHLCIPEANNEPPCSNIK